MKRIQQKHRTGCGVACVAMIAGKSYSSVMKNAQLILGWEKSKRTFYTDSSDLTKLLHSFSIKSEKCRAVRKWSSISETAIVAINHNERTNIWHWVVYHREADTSYVLDPQSKREVRKDFSRMRLRSYIPVSLTHPSRGTGESELR